jgi:hypothetical protein
MEVDPVEIIRQQPPGSCVWSRWMIPPRLAWEVGWLMREESAKITALGTSPDVEWRAGAQLEEIARVPVLVVMFVVRVGPYAPAHLWETWLNVCADGGQEALVDLQRQEQLLTHWYGDRGERERSLVSPNHLRDFAVRVQHTLDSHPRAPLTWGMCQFNQARARLERRYATVEALWHGLITP